MSDPREATNENTAPRTDDIEAVRPLHGVDRGGMGEDGWAEVPEDLVGGDPRLEDDGRTAGPRGAINGDEAMDAATGAPAVADSPGERESEPPRFDLDAAKSDAA